MLIINAYFPCDPQTKNYDDTELLETLAEIKCLIQKANCDQLMICGDLNCHFQRNTDFSSTVKDFVDNLPLSILWSNHEQSENNIENVDYTYCHVADNVVSFSTIDHFLTSEHLLTNICEVGVIHSSENLSNHSAIFCKVNVSNLDGSLESKIEDKKVNWTSATVESKNSYRCNLSNRLKRIVTPKSAECCNLTCKEEYRLLELDEYASNVMEAMQSAGKDTLPVEIFSVNRHGVINPPPVNIHNAHSI